MKKQPKRITDPNELRAGLYIRVLGSIELPLFFEVYQLTGRMFKWKFTLPPYMISKRYPIKEEYPLTDVSAVFIDDMIERASCYRFSGRLLAQLEENKRKNKEKIKIVWQNRDNHDKCYNYYYR